MRLPCPRRLTALALFTGLAPIATAHAAAPEEGRPLLPGYLLAGDDGAAALWRNPANLGLDPDPSMFALIDRSSEFGDRTGAAFAGQAGPLASGLVYRGGGGVPAWWTLGTALALRPERELGVGVGLGWQIPEGAGNNFLTWDIGATWRPTSWIGVSGTTRNLGAHDGTVLVPRAGGGLAVRPWEGRLVVGADVLAPINGVDAALLVEGTVRVRATEGLSLRVTGDQAGRIGLAADLSFGAAHAGAYAQVGVDDGGLGYALFTSADVDSREVIAGPDTAAVFRFNGAFPYQPVATVLARPQESYAHLLTRLRTAADDKRVKAIALHFEAMPFDLAQVEELRAEIATARANGKKVLVYLDDEAGNGAYFAAAAADRVLMHPAGELGTIGLSAELQFLRGTLDLLGVEPHFARRAEYKSAPETFTNTESSPAAREQLDALLDDLFDAWVAGIAAGRKLTPDKVRELVDGAPFSAKEALERGLVDELAYPDELEDKIDALAGDELNPDDSYAAWGGTSGWVAERRIAVIYVTGAIVSGESTGPGFFGGGGNTGADTVVRQLEEALEDDSVKAVVLRVDSPGGSAFASEDIWRAVQRVKEEGKPVIASMGSVAASGGYYVSCGADAIYALPTTITGSIGVYAGPFLNAERLFDKVGLGTEIHARGRHSAMYSISKPLDASEAAALDRLVGLTYAQFKERVGAGRQLDDAAVEQVARGRVWSGVDAREQKLVDELGGFWDAVARARTEAGIEAGQPVELFTYGSRFGLGGEVPERNLRGTLSIVAAELRAPPAIPWPAELEALDTWSALGDERVLTMLPWSLEIR